jgi:hypothetical protein
MNPSELRSLLSRFNPAKHHLVVDGYRTSKGDVINYELALIGSEGYRALVQQSRDYLLATLLGLRPQEFKPETWFQAVQEQVESWNKTLEGEHTPKNYGPEAMFSTYSIMAADEGGTTPILRNLKEIKAEIIEAGEKKKVNSASKTLAKAYIVAHTPMAEFVGQINLAPGKYTDVRIKDR